MCRAAAAWDRYSRAPVSRRATRRCGRTARDFIRLPLRPIEIFLSPLDAFDQAARGKRIVRAGNVQLVAVGGDVARVETGGEKDAAVRAGRSTGSRPAARSRQTPWWSLAVLVSLVPPQSHHPRRANPPDWSCCQPKSVSPSNSEIQPSANSSSLSSPGSPGRLWQSSPPRPFRRRVRHLCRPIASVASLAAACEQKSKGQSRSSGHSTSMSDSRCNS